MIDLSTDWVSLLRGGIASLNRQLAYLMHQLVNILQHYFLI